MLDSIMRLLFGEHGARPRSFDPVYTTLLSGIHLYHRLLYDNPVTPKKADAEGLRIGMGHEDDGASIVIHVFRNNSKEPTLKYTLSTPEIDTTLSKLIGLPVYHTANF